MSNWGWVKRMGKEIVERVNMVSSWECVVLDVRVCTHDRLLTWLTDTSSWGSVGRTYSMCPFTPRSKPKCQQQKCLCHKSCPNLFLTCSFTVYCMCLRWWLCFPSNVTLLFLPSGGMNECQKCHWIVFWCLVNEFEFLSIVSLFDRRFAELEFLFLGCNGV